ncbi:hypothetical protein [Caldimonas sp. KR1-144]|uniref:hypothetical protein n=1 Tax=Caldimonas sp. KR1-144 TaxID=3400911 RepID=UPI003C0B26BA
MSAYPRWHSTWHTAWQGSDIVVFRDDEEIDRFAADQIERVIFVHDGLPQSAGELPFAVVELAEEAIVLPADTGFAGRVHFERQSFWDARACVYWADLRTAALPNSCMARGGFGWLQRRVRFARLTRAELSPWLERWSLQGPQSWDQRRWQRIERNRPFASSGHGGAASLR